jgi:predicted phage terminase large subunit-like protein
LVVDDPSGQRLEQAKRGGMPVRHFCLPADIRRDQEVKPAIFRNKYKSRDGLLDPIRHPFKILEDFRLNKLGDYAYAGQFDQAPIPLSGGMFKVDKFVEDQATPKPSEFLAVVRWWDKAASVEKWGNFTVGVLMGVLKDPNVVPRFWVLDMVRERWDGATRERMIKKQAEIDEVLYGDIYTVGMEQEGGSGGKDSVQYSARGLAGHKVEYERATGDKIARADAFATQVGAGNVGLAKGLWNKRYKDDLQYFGPNAKVKDTVDSSSADFKFLNKKRHRAGGFFV